MQGIYKIIARSYKNRNWHLSWFKNTPVKQTDSESFAFKSTLAKVTLEPNTLPKVSYPSQKNAAQFCQDI